MSLADVFSDSTMVRLVRDKVAARGFYLDDSTAIALLKEIGVEPTHDRLQSVKLGYELGCASRARATALRALPVRGVA